MTTLKITQLEEKVLEIISWGDEYEETPTECFENIMDSFNGSNLYKRSVKFYIIKKI